MQKKEVILWKTRQTRNSANTVVAKFLMQQLFVHCADAKSKISRKMNNPTFNVNTKKPNIYIKTVDNHNFHCWEITGNSCDLQIGTYAMKELIKGITTELSVSLHCPVDFTSWHVYLEGKDISGALSPDKAFITAPLIFEDLSKIKVTLKTDGTEILSMRMNNVYKNDHIQFGNLLIEEN